MNLLNCLGTAKKNEFYSRNPNLLIQGLEVQLDTTRKWLRITTWQQSHSQHILSTFLLQILLQREIFSFASSMGKKIKRIAKIVRACIVGRIYAKRLYTAFSRQSGPY